MKKQDKPKKTNNKKSKARLLKAKLERKKPQLKSSKPSQGRRRPTANAAGQSEVQGERPGSNSEFRGERPAGAPESRSERSAGTPGFRGERSASFRKLQGARPTRREEIQEEQSDYDRNPDACPLYRKCGGCQLQNMTYPRQLQFKQSQVGKMLHEFHRVEPIIGMENPYHYRNKVQAAFALTRAGEVVSGIYQTGTHHIVPVDSCMIDDEIADRIIVTIRKMLPGFKMLPYNEDSEQGFLRHVLIKRGFASGQVMVVLVVASPMFSLKKKFAAALLLKHPEITTILLNLNIRQTSMVLGEREEILYGPGYIEDTLCGCIFRISAKSFYQINPVQTEVLYEKAIELAGLTGKETVLDAYCGIGTIGLVASRHAGQVIGVELNKDAVKDAIANARRNQIQNTRFYQSDAGEFMEAVSQDKQRIDVVFMDPPRAGSDEKFLASLVKLAPAKVVYISCNPETQARDLFYLTEHGYAVTYIQPVDMFPHTNHVETVILMTNSGS